MTELTITAPARAFSWIEKIPICLASLTVLLFTTMPLDRGFPTVQIGRPVHAGVLAVISTFLVTFVISNGAVLEVFKRKYAALQSLAFTFLCVSALRAESPPVAIALALRYFCTFGLSYVVFTYLLERHGRDWLVASVVAGSGFAALVGAYEMLLTQPPMPYYQFYVNAEVPGIGRTLSGLGRSHGTMGNPILMSALMLLSIPFVLELRSMRLKVPALLLVLLAGLATVSRTYLLGLSALLLGLVTLYKGRQIRLWTSLAVITGFAGVLIFALDTTGDFRNYWLGRLGLQESYGGYAQMNLELRKQATLTALNDMDGNWTLTEWLVGEGPLASTKIGEAVGGEFATIDNSPLTLVYEHGLLGWAFVTAPFVVVLYQFRRMRKTSLHWYSIVAIFLLGLSFNVEAYSMFNILAAGSVAMVTARNRLESVLPIADG